MTIGGPFLDNQQSFQCILIVACVIPPRSQAGDWYEALHPICSSVTVGCIHGLRHEYTETGIKLHGGLSHLSVLHLPGVLGMLSLCLVDIWSANVEIIHYVQGMLKTYISGAHIQVDQWHSHACNMIRAYSGHCDYGIWGPGYWCAGPTLYTCKFVSQSFVCIDVLYGITGIAANPVSDQTFSTEGSGSCTFCGWFSLGTSNHLVLSD